MTSNAYASRSSVTQHEGVRLQVDADANGIMTKEPDLTERIRRLLGASRATMVFTGAGLSTESGIPDFRSPGGLWQRYRPIDFSEFVSSAEARRETWRRRFAIGSVMDNAEPNQGHIAVARLVAQGKVNLVVTQNIDGLHQASGIPSEKLVELHGNGTYAKCLDCAARYELSEIRAHFERTEEPPDCTTCGGFVKPATISFGQAMPEEEVRRAEDAALGCDLCLVLGSSLVVYPAAGIPALAKQRGAALIIVNREPTDLDDVADVALHSEIGPTLSSVVFGSAETDEGVAK